MRPAAGHAARAALAALEDGAAARLVAAGTPVLALDFAVRVAVDAALAAQAQLPTFEAWRQQQETCGRGGGRLWVMCSYGTLTVACPISR